ncbi:hotdog domain-containing protein [Kitasatospora sp. NPDC036755]|uniref:acyl-CoA thioesterase n=1 Tax=Kitasatospora sp. NPDC036755 TaxID=3154600 RepID=UPI0033D99284
MTSPSVLSRTPADSAVTLAHIMSDHDTNLYGSVHGGVMMKLIDDAAAAAAGRHAGVPAVTVSVEEMSFLAPVRAGDLLTVRARVEHVGRTSMDVAVVVTSERWNLTGPVTRVATAQLVFVAIDADGRPHRVPELVVEGSSEERRDGAARERRTGRTGPEREPVE